MSPESWTTSCLPWRNPRPSSFSYHWWGGQVWGRWQKDRSTQPLRMSRQSTPPHRTYFCPSRTQLLPCLCTRLRGRWSSSSRARPRGGTPHCRWEGQRDQPWCQTSSSKKRPRTFLWLRSPAPRCQGRIGQTATFPLRLAHLPSHKSEPCHRAQASSCWRPGCPKFCCNRNPYRGQLSLPPWLAQRVSSWSQPSFSVLRRARSHILSARPGTSSAWSRRDRQEEPWSRWRRRSPQRHSKAKPPRSSAQRCAPEEGNWDAHHHAWVWRLECTATCRLRQQRCCARSWRPSDCLLFHSYTWASRRPWEWEECQEQERQGVLWSRRQSK